jgi:hypothetical protein
VHNVQNSELEEWVLYRVAGQIFRRAHQPTWKQLQAQLSRSIIDQVRHPVRDPATAAVYNQVFYQTREEINAANRQYQNAQHQNADS